VSGWLVVSKYIYTTFRCYCQSLHCALRSYSGFECTQ